MLNCMEGTMGSHVQRLMRTNITKWGWVLDENDLLWRYKDVQYHTKNLRNNEKHQAKPHYTCPTLSCKSMCFSLIVSMESERLGQASITGRAVYSALVHTNPLFLVSTCWSRKIASTWGLVLLEWHIHVTKLCKRTSNSLTNLALLPE